jgi:hypothetical protein
MVKLAHFSKTADEPENSTEFVPALGKARIDDFYRLAKAELWAPPELSVTYPEPDCHVDE